MKKICLVAAIALFTSIQLKAQKEQIYTSNSYAIAGYDPVAYFKNEKAVKGKKEYSYQWKDANWLFSTKEDMDLFAANPEKYAPQYGGYCAYGLSEGHKAPPDPNTWTIVDGKIYFNYSKDVKTMWIKNPKERIQEADKQWSSIKDKE